ncbi:MAG: iron-containing alcohol dehydrogenase [Desulfamplus sp.]|nr:iron-containing alcohol dehydrogenase [Desulfamplus sp.]
MDFDFWIPTKIHFGVSSLEKLEQVIGQGGYAKIGLVFDHNLDDHSLLNGIRDLIKNHAQIVESAVSVAEPTYRFLDEFRSPFMNSQIEAVVGVGGGSTLDAAKAIAVLVNNTKPAITYRGFDQMTEPTLPIYAVPTTAGTGSEITPNASFVDDISKKKLGINGEVVRPRAAFLHPGFIMTCPQGPATSAALDALVHAVEAFAARKATPMARMFASEAISLVLGNIENAVIQKNQSAVENIFLGSLLAGIAMMHSGTGPAAAFSYPLGVHLHIPHGFAGGFCLPHVMRWNVDHGYYGYADLLPNNRDNAAKKERAEDVVEKFFQVWRALGVPQLVQTLINEKLDLTVFLDDLSELRGAIDQNPISMADADLANFLTAHFPQ